MSEPIKVTLFYSIFYWSVFCLFLLSRLQNCKNTLCARVSFVTKQNGHKKATLCIREAKIQNSTYDWPILCHKQDTRDTQHMIGRFYAINRPQEIQISHFSHCLISASLLTFSVCMLLWKVYTTNWKWNNLLKFYQYYFKCPENNISIFYNLFY